VARYPVGPLAAAFTAFSILIALSSLSAKGVLLFYARTIAYFTFDLLIERWVQSFNPPRFDWLVQIASEIGCSPQVYVWSGLVILVVFLIGL
jgi:hypothetical protein